MLLRVTCLPSNSKLLYRAEIYNIGKVIFLTEVKFINSKWLAYLEPLLSIKKQFQCRLKLIGKKDGFSREVKKYIRGKKEMKSRWVKKYQDYKQQRQKIQNSSGMFCLELKETNKEHYGTVEQKSWAEYCEKEDQHDLWCWQNKGEEFVGGKRERKKQKLEFIKLNILN